VQKWYEERVSIEFLGTKTVRSQKASLAFVILSSALQTAFYKADASSMDMT
jgi:hypothetical protein